MINLTDREQQILEILSEHSSANVAEISKQVSVSEVTVRSDLNSLSEKGFVLRTHGGAVPAFHPSILERRKKNIEAKERIAKAAADLISDGDHIMISAGSTTELIAKHLLGKHDIHIVTNSTLILPYVRVNPSVTVVFTGGEFRPSGEAMTGSVALRMLEQFHVKKAFIGTDGFSIKGGATAHLAEVAEVVKKMAEQSDEIIMTADSSKYSKTGFAHILPLEKLDRIITDSNFEEENKVILKKKGIIIDAV